MKNYHFVNQPNGEPPAFFEKLMAAISKSWDSLGSVSCNIDEVEGGFEATFSPAIRESCGGKSDGEICYSTFNFNIGSFVKVFDKSLSPKVNFSCLNNKIVPHLVFKGQIEGFNLTVNILEYPINGQEAVERIYTSGPKKGQVEPIK